jgi:hypothetical protein
MPYVEALLHAVINVPGFLIQQDCTRGRNKIVAIADLYLLLQLCNFHNECLVGMAS